MTVTIKNSNGNVIGTADSINIVSKYKDIASAKEGLLYEKILETNFSLINPSYHPYYTLYRDNLIIEAKVGFINNLSIYSDQIISLTNCTLIKDYFGIAKDFKVINLYNLESKRNNMTVKIKDSNGNVVGNAEDIFIIIKDVRETYQFADIVRDWQGNYISSKPVGKPIQLKGELLINFNLINPNVELSKLTEEYTIEATKAYLSFGNYTETERLTTLVKCKFNGEEGSSQGLYFTNLITSNNIESVFKYYFPKLKYYLVKRYGKSNNELIAYLTKQEYLLYLRFIYIFDKWRVCLWFGENDDKLELHESTDLNELVQVTKQKLNDMFADWMSKVN